MGEIALWILDNFPDLFSKVNFQTVELLLEIRDGNIELVKEDLTLFLS